jgi:HPt (histidine-containing phosphotransfer) domain-containing protein
MFFGWNEWKKGFDVWEDATARYLEQVMKSPLFLGPSGAALSSLMRLKAARDRALAETWASIGLPTRRDQEKTLHLLHVLESRIRDLEEQLEDAREGQEKAEQALFDEVTRRGERVSSTVRS